MTLEEKIYGKPHVPQGAACGLSSVDVQAKVIINGVSHAGIATHVCGLQKGHEQPVCQCDCGHRWTKNVK